MPDDLSEKLERLCERMGVPPRWRTTILGRFEAGRREHGHWNHLGMSATELREESEEELADWFTYRVLIPWSQAWHSTLAGIEEEDVDGVIDMALVDGFLEFLRLIDGGENGQPAHER